ncbi:MAG TPA: DUF3300 domain-containing protein [Amaricoccus sp.]|nr:DUF3300 domain-containing protein [Amaricoccus sp.]
MQKLSAMVAIVAGMATAMGPVAASAQDALRDAVIEQQRQSDPMAAATDDLALTSLLGDAELDDLVAPVALYPDPLLAQVLVAATYPSQIAEADQFLGEFDQLSDAEAAAELDKRDWDPSVLVLVSGFPTVIERMADDLDWTERLGHAMLAQDDDVLAAVQRRRVEAQTMGYLADNSAQTIETDPSGDISITPADPEVVYVPSYDPEAVYTTRSTARPYVAPVAEATSGGFQPNPLLTGALAFGAALLVSQLFGNDHDDQNSDGWDDYWHRRQFDWHDRQFYPRPRWQWADDRPDHPWGWERDRYWDPHARRWHRGGPLAARAYDDDRRDTLGWLVVHDPDRREPWVRGFDRPRQENERALRQAERQAAERRQARLAAERREDRRARQAEEAQEARVAAERREARQKAAAAERRRDAARAEREHDARQKALAERRARAEADERAKAQADRRTKAQADAKAKAEAKAKADADARRKAQAERRAKAEADAKAKAAADARAKAQADRKAKAQADAKAKATADARTKTQADRRAKAAADAKAKAAADAQAKARADRRAKAQADARAKADADARSHARTERRAKAAQAAHARQDARAKRAEPQRPRNAKCRPNDEKCQQQR